MYVCVCVCVLGVGGGTYAGSDLGLRSWELAANTLAQKSVRVLAFKDAPYELHVEMAKHLQFTSICRLENILPSFFVIGPVTNMAGNRDTITKSYPTGVDETYAWLIKFAASIDVGALGKNKYTYIYIHIYNIQHTEYFIQYINYVIKHGIGDRSTMPARPADIFFCF